MRGHEIHGLFYDLKLRQKDLAKATGHSPSAISRMLREVFSLTAEVEAEAVHMIKIAKLDACLRVASENQD